MKNGPERSHRETFKLALIWQRRLILLQALGFPLKLSDTLKYRLLYADFMAFFVAKWSKNSLRTESRWSSARGRSFSSGFGYQTLFVAGFAPQQINWRTIAIGGQVFACWTRGFYFFKGCSTVNFRHIASLNSPATAKYAISWRSRRINNSATRSKSNYGSVVDQGWFRNRRICVAGNRNGNDD